MAETALLVDAVCAALAEIANSIILPRYKQLAAADIRTKTNPNDLVTIADEESEQALAPKLMSLLPGSKVVGEEAAAADPGALPGLLAHDPVWIVDPIDGTLNFVHGRDAFASVVALVSRGETILGWIHDPISGRTLWAEKGKGAWRRQSIRTSGLRDDRVRLADDLQRPGVDLKFLNAALYAKEFAATKGAFARNVMHGSAAHDYWALAEGRLHISGYKNLKPWDHAAGVLIYEEAGGYSRLLSGAPYNPVAAGQVGLMSAANAEIWQRVATLRQADPSQTAT